MLIVKQKSWAIGYTGRKETVNTMHITLVKVKDIYVSFNIESVQEKIQITATFTKDGEVVHKIYNVSTMLCTGTALVAKLLDKEFACFVAKDMIERANASVHSPFRKG